MSLLCHQKIPSLPTLQDMSDNILLSLETSEAMKILSFSGGKSDIHLPGLPSSFKASPAAYLPYPEIQTVIE
jgi:hypothetical protein